MVSLRKTPNKARVTKAQAKSKSQKQLQNQREKGL